MIVMRRSHITSIMMIALLKETSTCPISIWNIADTVLRIVELAEAGSEPACSAVCLRLTLQLWLAILAAHATGQGYPGLHGIAVKETFSGQDSCLTIMMGSFARRYLGRGSLLASSLLALGSPGLNLHVYFCDTADSL